ncbi:MAG: yrrN [Bacillales bacterium]|jgi:putative protease|nr:yrrN [Bacillales bacterium]
MKKPELLVTPSKITELVPLIEAGADAFVIGEQRYGLRLSGEFLREDVKAASEITRQHGKKVYVAMNAIMHNDRIDELNDYISFLDHVGVDGIIFGDPAVLLAVRETAPHMKLHWNTETTATNYFTANYWGSKGAKRAVLARELSMDEVIETKENADVEIEVQVHGMTCMFQSKRTLINNYMNFMGKDLEKIENSRKAYLHDKERDTRYPIFQDENGTHIMCPNDICLIEELGEMIDAGIDSFKIEGILKSTDYLVKITQLYRKAIDLYCEEPSSYEESKATMHAEIEKIQPKSRPIDTGFYFKETVY